MVRGRWIGLLAAALALVGVFAAGCGKETSRPSNTTESLDINDPVGGYTSQDEQPAFGDASLLASGDAEQSANDPMQGNADIIRIQSADSTHIYAVTMLWGILGGDPSAGSIDLGGNGDEVDWTGHLQVNRGAVLVASTIAFERDDELLGRTDPMLVDWISHTTTSFDGIRVLILQPFEQGNDGTTDSLTIVAGANSWSFAVNDLANLEQTYSVSPEGNKFSIRAFRVSLRASTRGFVGGAWLSPESTGGRGSFRGRWISRDGELAGFVKGYFGVNDQGDKVYFGKWINRDGTFHGFVTGHWEDSGMDESTGMSSIPRTFGVFGGEIRDADRTVIGAMRGHWRSARGGWDGFFEGVWSVGARP